MAYMTSRHRFIGPISAMTEATVSVRDAFHTEPQTHTLPHKAADVAVGDWVDVHEDGTLTVLAAAGSALARIYALAVDKAFDPIHPPAVLAEADALYRNPGIDDPSLVDRCGLPFVTIDEVSSKDLDQALCIQRDADGGWLVWYAIADAAWFARPGQPIFDEALRRGATCYLPGLVVPMMPACLSEDACSLNPMVDRRALLFRMSLDEAGVRRGCTIERARIRSRAKLDYDGVDAWLKGTGPLACDDPAVLESLRGLRTVGELRIQQAVERDVVRLRRVESAVRMEGADGMRFVAFSDPRNDVERYNEQISLLCNMEGAQYLMDAPDFLRPIFRVHPAPSPSRVDEMREQIEAIVHVNQLDASWRWRPDDETLAVYLDRLPRGGAAGRLARAIHRQAMMINGRSSFTAVPGLHHGVGAEAYARFSAPMREIVGVYVHLQCWEKLRGAPLPGQPTGAEEEALREAVIAASNAARSRQRAIDHETNRFVLDQIFSDDSERGDAPWRRGTVMGIARSKIHVQLDDIGIDVKVYRHHLERELGVSLHTEGRTCMRTEGPEGFRVRVGEAVEVRVSGRDPQVDRWVLALRAVTA
ncbi:MAG: ribonuclease R [Myxococcota bacterium]|jgi:ribonuclease R